MELHANDHVQMLQCRNFAEVLHAGLPTDPIMTHKWTLLALARIPDREAVRLADVKESTGAGYPSGGWALPTYCTFNKKLGRIRVCVRKNLFWFEAKGTLGPIAAIGLYNATVDALAGWWKFSNPITLLKRDFGAETLTVPFHGPALAIHLRTPVIKGRLTLDDR